MNVDHQLPSDSDILVPVASPLKGQAQRQKKAAATIAEPKQLALKKYMQRYKLGWLGGTVKLGVFASYIVGMAALSWVFLMGKDMPEAERLWQRSRPVSVKFVDRNERDLMTHGAHEASPVSIKTLPPDMVHAVLAIEDRRFYDHVGVDPYSIVRAIVRNLQNNGYSEGASTITQQLVKNVFLNTEKTIVRKTKEAILAIWLERDFTKDELLEMYLERVYFGAGTYGVDAAARSYFGKPVTEIGLAESALLAGLLKAPSTYNPRANPKNSGKRTARVLNAMKDAGYIDRWQHYNALSEPVHFRRYETDKIGEYFVKWVWPQIEEKIGTPTTDLTVITTLDAQAQKLADEALVEYLDSDAARRKDVSQGAIVTLDGAGEVLAMTGGRAFKDSEFNRAVQARRQPGSAFKPFVYLAAFESGIEPWDYRYDAPVDIPLPPGSPEPVWTPRNFSNTYKGAIKIETALASSVNTIAASLGQEVGMERISRRAVSLGLKDMKPHPSLTLGAQEVTPLALTQSYQPFAAYGYQTNAFGLKTIKDVNGNVLYDRSLDRNIPLPVKQIDQNSLGLINRAMKLVVDQGTGRAARVAGRDVAGKTGTTNSYRDAWFVGYVPDMVTTVWLGNDDNSPMKKMTGGSAPAKIWKSYMGEMLKDMPPAHLSIAQEPIMQSKDTRFNLLLSDIENALPY